MVLRARTRVPFVARRLVIPEEEGICFVVTDIRIGRGEDAFSEARSIFANVGDAHALNFKPSISTSPDMSEVKLEAGDVVYLELLNIDAYAKNISALLEGWPPADSMAERALRELFVERPMASLPVSAAGRLEPEEGRDWWTDPQSWDYIGEIGHEPEHNQRQRTCLLVRKGRTATNPNVSKIFYALVRYPRSDGSPIDAWKNYLGYNWMTIISREAVEALTASL